MRIGTLSSVQQASAYQQATPPDISGEIIVNDTGIVPGTPEAGGYTSGPSNSGDTLMCPPGYPYDYTIHDCHGYAGSKNENTVMQLQAKMDLCASQGGQWDTANGVCLKSWEGSQPKTLIPGVPDWMTYAAGALIGVMALASMRGR